MFFKHIEAAPADPILGLGEAFKAETRPEKVNLGIGVYKDASGATPIVKAVKEAENACWKAKPPKLPDHRRRCRLQRANPNPAVRQRPRNHRQPPRQNSAKPWRYRRIAYCGTEFAKRQLNAQTIWISNPTWSNHNAIAKAVGIQDKPYRYYDAAKHCLDWDGMIEDLNQAQKATSSCCTAAATTLPVSTLRPNNGKL